MIPLSAERLAEITGGTVVSGEAARSASTVTIDSREVGADACFVAIAGPRHDGHDFVAEAVEAGARVVLVHRDDVRAPAGATTVRVADTTRALQEMGAAVRQACDPVVVAITGSIGKTTTKELTARVLSTRFRVHATPGNLNNHWGLPLALLGLEPGHRVMVAELAMSRTGEIRRLAQIATPDVGVVTNVAPVHMENFSDLEGVAAAKAELAEALPDDGTLVVNADDPRTREMARRHAPARGRTVTFGLAGDADVRATDARPGAGGWELELCLPDGSRTPITLPLPGSHSLSNFLAAAAVAHELGIPASTLVGAARDLRLPAGRGRLRDLPGGLRLVDETYNASPVAVAHSIEMLMELPAAGRRVLVLGDMLELGDWSERSHREVGARAAAAGVDLLVAVGERARAVAEAARQAGDPERVLHFAEVEDAARELPSRLRPGDLLLVKGSRGMALERIVAALESERPPTRRSLEG